MRLDRIMWLFGALFLMFGLPLFFIEDEGWRKYFLGLSALFLGCFGLAMAGDGVLRGKIKLQLTLLTRRDQPITFWLAVTVISAAGVATIATGIWAMFFKVW